MCYINCNNVTIIIATFFSERRNENATTNNLHVDNRFVVKYAGVKNKHIRYNLTNKP